MARIVFAIAILALHMGRALAQTPAPAPEALVERFMAAIPDTAARHDARFREETVAHLRSANPAASEESLRAAADAARACFEPLNHGQTYRTLRHAARLLGAEKLTRLTAFYEGPDYGIFNGLMEAGSRGMMTDADRAEQRRIAESYPLFDFAASTRTAINAMAADPAFERELARCRAVGAAALARRGLRRP